MQLHNKYQNLVKPIILILNFCVVHHTFSFNGDYGASVQTLLNPSGSREIAMGHSGIQHLPSSVEFATEGELCLYVRTTISNYL